MYEYLFKTTREELQFHEREDGSVDTAWLHAQLAANTAFSSHSDAGAGRLVNGWPEVCSLGDTYVRLSLFCDENREGNERLPQYGADDNPAQRLWCQPYNAIYWDGVSGNAADGLARFFSTELNLSYKKDKPYTALLDLIHVLPEKGSLNYAGYCMSSEAVSECVKHLTEVFPGVYTEAELDAPPEPSFWSVNAIPRSLPHRMRIAQVLFQHSANLPAEMLGAILCLDMALYQDNETASSWYTLIFDRHRYASLFRRSDLKLRLDALVKMVQPLCKNELVPCGTAEGITLSGVSLSNQLAADLHHVGIHVVPLVK